MKFLKLAALIFVILLVGWFIGRLTAPAHEGASSPEGEAAAATEYTCSMHPQIRQPNPGTCPICAMDLIPAGQAERGSGNDREIKLTPYARALARIATQPAKREFPDAEIRLLGRVVNDESLIRSITARFPARIERLYVNYTGIQVNEGDHLAMIYSPDLLTAQAELLSARRFNDERAIRSSRDKLSLWGLSESAIKAIESSGKPKDTMDIDAPLGGFVTEKMVSDGDYVETGDVMFQIADLSRLWVVLDAYERDLPWLRFGQQVTFTAEAVPGREFTGRVAFIPPTIDLETRTFKVRVNVDNDDLALRPGMYLSGVVHAGIAADGVVIDADLAGKWISPMHPEIVKDAPGECDVCGMDLVPAEELGYVMESTEPPLTIPASAVLRTGRRAIVYVELPDREDPTYEGREITLGPRAGDVYLVASGIEEGERVVTNGAFKLDSALQLLARPSMMSAPDESEETEPAPVIDIAPEILNDVLKAYLALGSALAGENLEDAQAALRTMMETTGHSGPLPDLVHEMLAADDLAAIRRPHFETLSNALIAAATAHSAALTDEVIVMTCPMVYDDRGADWLQASEPLLNPYFGDAMLRCGEVKSTIGPAETGSSQQ